MWWRRFAEVQTEHQNGEERDLRDFGARRTDLSISKTADLLGFSHTTISSVYREWSEKEKNIQWAAVVWTKMPCWRQRSEKNRQTGYNNNNNNNLLHLYSAFLGSQSALHRRRGISSTTTNVQHPSGWCDGSHIVPECPTHSSLLVERRQWWSQSVYGDD